MSVGQGSMDENLEVCELGTVLVLWMHPCAIEMLAVNRWLAMTGVVV
jgi:hypothetical protein